MRGTVRRIGSAGGAITAMACCSVAMAFAATGASADTTAVPYAYPGAYLEPVPGSFTVDSFYGSPAAQPGPPNSYQGHEQFNVFDAATGNRIGSFGALVTHGLDAGNPNIQILVTAVTDRTPGTGSGAVPNVGSVFNFAGSDPAHPTNVYVDLAGADGSPNTVYDNGIGGLWEIWPTSTFIPEFDASAHIDVHNALVNPTDFVLPNGDHVMADPGDPETYSAVTNTAPWAVAVQGTDQLFDIYNSDGDLVGKFTGETISTADIFGGHSFEILVTDDGGAANVGRGAGEIPPVGSVFNMLYYFSPQAYSVYSAYNGTGADGANQISQHWNLFGLSFDTTPTFDAVKGFTDGTNLFDSIPLENGTTIAPVGTQTHTGINGIPNGGFFGNNTTVQGTQEFTLTDSTGATHDFWANVTTYGDSAGKLSEALYLNPDLFGDQAVPGLPDGSLVEYTQYSSLMSTLEINPDPFGLSDGSADDITRVLYTPLGAFDISASLAGWVDFFFKTDF